jgi:hypothetical protein
LRRTEAIIAPPAEGDNIITRAHGRSGTAVIVSAADPRLLMGRSPESAIQSPSSQGARLW